MVKKFLIAGANGYVGSRLSYRLAEEGHNVVALVRSKDRFFIPDSLVDRINVIECDLLKRQSLDKIPRDLECAYYLVHSMSSQEKRFFDLEEQSAVNFTDAIENTISYHKPNFENDINYPKSSIEYCSVDMSNLQISEYRHYLKKILSLSNIQHIDFSVLDKRKMNYFLSVTRQLSNTVDKSPDSPKIIEIFNYIKAINSKQ